MTWKKLSDDEYFLENDKYSYAKIWKIGLSSKERRRRGIGAYGFATRIGRQGREVKRTFATKKGAVEQLKRLIRGEI